MTRLLVSVQNAVEVELAIAAGVDLVDLKEPSRGSLGAVDRWTAEECLSAAAGRVPMSLALGELLDFDAGPEQVPTGAAYAKLGLAGCRRLKDWRGSWAAAMTNLPARTRPVAVAYADWQTADSPLPAEVLHLARERQLRAVLVDTFDKRGGGLLDLWSVESTRDFIERVHDGGALAVVAGSLTPAAIERVLPLEPDYIAVRGAACEEGRAGPISRAKLRSLVDLVRGACPRRADAAASLTRA